MGYDLTAKIYNPELDVKIEELNKKWSFSRSFLNIVFNDHTGWFEENLTKKDFEVLKDFTADVPEHLTKKDPKIYLDIFLKIKYKLSKDKNLPIFYWIKDPTKEGFSESASFEMDGKEWHISGGWREKDDTTVRLHREQEYRDIDVKENKEIKLGGKTFLVIPEDLYDRIKKEVDMFIDLCETALKMHKSICIYLS